jgi:hypothetical protein
MYIDGFGEPSYNLCTLKQSFALAQRGRKDDIGRRLWYDRVSGMDCYAIPISAEANHMIAVIEEERARVAEACRCYCVKRLDLFGSAAIDAAFDAENSDLDFLVIFDATESMNAAEQYFGLLSTLKDIFGRHVDLVTEKSLRNPYFIERVRATRKPLYAS